MKVVLDASVIIKWFVADQEEFLDEALLLYQHIRDGHVEVIQPLHWQAEVLAVLTRKFKPEYMEEPLMLLEGFEFKVINHPDIYRRAINISSLLEHHLFDTLYLGLALEQKAMLVTDDRKFFRKAEKIGNICLLQDWRPAAAADS
ncbi:MAG: type II toxin-antitoxin system VapC family toxin [Thiolinea sp.]